MTIRDIVHNCFKTGVLSLRDEENLRYLMVGKYGIEDFRAIIRLQWAVQSGEIRQASRCSEARCLDSAKV